MKTFRSNLHRVLFTFPLIALGACGGDDTPEDEPICVGGECPDAGEDTGQGGDTDGGETTGCAADSECSEGYVCVEETCRIACTADEACGPNQRCEDAICVALPTCDEGCADGTICNSCTNYCQVSEGGTVCEVDANCGFDSYCNPCTSLCDERLELCAPCDNDAQCVDASGLCLPFSDGQSYCGQGCGVACPTGYECNTDFDQCVPLTGSCAEIEQCEENSDCPGGERCSVTQVCVPGCSTDADCFGEEYCAYGECKPPCVSTDECEAGQECNDGRCRVPGGCLSSQECLEPETFCDRNLGTCVPGCEVDADCLNAAMECVAGSCTPRGCRGNFSCAFGEVCDFESGACVEAEGDYCASCDASDLDSCGVENACLRMESREGEEGDFCMIACAEDEANACPQGFTCSVLEIENQEPRRVCTRDCFRTPVQ